MNTTPCHFRLPSNCVKLFQHLLKAGVLTACVSLIGCATIGEQMPQKEAQPRKEIQPEYLERSKTLFAEGKYEAALQENQKALAEGRGAADAALFNMGLISAYSLNPKKDFPKALHSFKALVAQYPRSSFAEQGKVWIQVLEEHQKIAEDRQKLVEEKRTLTRERETLSQEREKLKYTAEKSRQVDMEIEKRRRKSLNR
jgi:tetratricopeptide (TPR) repeat protein